MASQRHPARRSAPDRRRLPDELPPRLNRDHVLRALDSLIDARMRFLEETGVAGAAAERRELHATIVAVAGRAGWKSHARTALAAARAQAAAATAAWIDRALDLLADAERGEGCPASFHGALKYKSWLRGRSPRAFAEVTGCGEQLLADYSEDRKRPGDEMRPRIEAFAVHLGLEPDYFWQRRVSSGARARIYKDRLPQDLTATRHDTEKLKRFLPADFTTLPETAQAEWIEKYRDLCRERRPHQKLAAQRRDGYALKDVPPALQAEMACFFQFRQPKRLPLGGTSRKHGRNPKSIAMLRDGILRFFGFLVHRLHELGDVEGYAAGGPYACMRVEDLRLGHLAAPALVFAYAAWIEHRKQSFEREAGLTRQGREFYKEIERMTRPGAALPSFAKARRRQ